MVVKREKRNAPLKGGELHVPGMVLDRRSAFIDVRHRVVGAPVILSRSEQ